MVLESVVIPQYFSWDESVPEARILKFNDVNLLKQKELQSLHPE